MNKQKGLRGTVKSCPSLPKETTTGKTITTFVLLTDGKDRELVEVVVLQDGDNRLVDEVYAKIKEGDFVILAGSRNAEGTYFLRAFTKDTPKDAGFFCGFKTEKDYRDFHKKCNKQKEDSGLVQVHDLDGAVYWERKELARKFNGKWRPLTDYLCLMLGEAKVSKRFREFAATGLVMRGGKIRFDNDGYKKLLEELEAQILF